MCRGAYRGAETGVSLMPTPSSLPQRRSGHQTLSAKQSPLSLLQLRLYLYTLPFTYALSAREGLVTLTVGVAALALLFCVFDVVFRGVEIPSKFPIFLLILFCLNMVFAIIEQNIANDKTINHFAAYSGSILLFGIVPMLLVSSADSKRATEIICSDLVIVARLCCVVAILQFWMNNFTRYTFEDFIPYPQGIEAQSMFLGRFFRSRGFAAEPGHFSLLLEMLVPFVVYTQREIWLRQRWRLLLDVALIFLGFCCIGSPTGFIILGLSYVAAQAISGGGPRASTLWLLLLSCGAIVAIYEVMIRDLVGGASLIDVAWEMISGKLDSSSAEVRVDRFALGWTLLSEASPSQLIFGYGPASYFNLNLGDQSIIQLFQLLLVECGIVGTGLFLGAFVSLARSAHKALSDARLFYFWSMCALGIHYTFISNYYYPYIWLLFALRFALRDRRLG